MGAKLVDSQTQLGSARTLNMLKIASLCKERGATTFRGVTEDTSSSLLAVRDIHSGTGYGQVANDKQNPLNPKQPNGEINVQKMSTKTHLDPSIIQYLLKP